MNKEELDSFEELNINLQDIDDLDMGLEIISYKVRKSLQELADIIINQSCQISTYKDKEKEIRRICKAQKRVANTFIKADKDFIYHDTTGEDILQILNEGAIE